MELDSAKLDEAEDAFGGNEPDVFLILPLNRLRALYLVLLVALEEALARDSPGTSDYRNWPIL